MRQRCARLPNSYGERNFRRSEESDRIRGVGGQGLVDIPMLDDAAPVQAEEIGQGQQRLAVHLEMDHADIVLKGLVQDGAVERGDQERQEADRGGAALGRVRAVVDVVRGDVGEVGVCGVLLDVQLVDEVEEDSTLLAWVDGLGRAIRAGGEGRWLRVRVALGSWTGQHRGNEPQEGCEGEKTHCDNNTMGAGLKDL